MPEVELSCGLAPSPDFESLVVLAERLGYHRVWIYDSAPLWEDPFVHLALAARRTTCIGLATAVLIPDQRSEMAMASAIATVARMSQGRFRACFGTGFTSRLTMGRRPMTLAQLGRYVTAVRGLLAGETVDLDGAPARMLHADGLTAPRPVEVPLWLSAFGPRGAAVAADVADGIVGQPHPSLPTATIVSGTVLGKDESKTASRVRDAIGPWRMVDWHNAYATHGAEGVGALPGGRNWREELESLAPEGERYLLTFESHVTHLLPRDRLLLDHIDTSRMVGTAERLDGRLERLGGYGFHEVVYTPTGPDIPRELEAFAEAGHRHLA